MKQLDEITKNSKAYDGLTTYQKSAIKDRLKILSSYDLNSPELNSKSNSIIEENEYFEELYEFFKSEYQNSKILLDEIKR